MKFIINIIFLAIYMLFLSCDESFLVKDCNGVIGGTAIEDDCGVCSGGNTGFEHNADMSCNGHCLQGELILALDNLGNGTCNDDSWYIQLNCKRWNCDNGDCGSWDGNQCMGPNGASVIKYKDGSTGSVIDTFTTNDPSIPENFLWNTYYSVTPGTFAFSYTNYIDDTIWEGTYTTFINYGVPNSNSGNNECFQLEMYLSIGPIFSNYSFTNECMEHWDSIDRLDNSLIVKDNKLNKYLEDINKNDYLENEISYLKIMEQVSSRSNVKIQKGKNFIMKYYNRKIIP